jgi:hypothetical protein
LGSYLRALLGRICPLRDPHQTGVQSPVAAGRSAGDNRRIRPGDKEIAMSAKPARPAQQKPNDALKDRLSKVNEITITVTSRNSGRIISIPVWFVFEDDKLYLVPVN